MDKPFAIESHGDAAPGHTYSIFGAISDTGAVLCVGNNVTSKATIKIIAANVIITISIVCFICTSPLLSDVFYYIINKYNIAILETINTNKNKLYDCKLNLMCIKCYEINQGTHYDI